MSGPMSIPLRTGGDFLLDATAPTDVFTPERLTDEHRAIGQMVDEFWSHDIEPSLDALRRREPGVARRLLRAAAAAGLTSMQIPEDEGGLALDLPSVMVVVERLARDASYLGWYLGHCGIGMLPLLLYGTPELRRRYLPRMAAAELIGAYALTEPHAGTDALAIRTRADLTPDGRHYVLNGQKMWITNGGEADLFTVFAKVNGEALTAFLVERSAGLTNGPDEQKMGLSGTSTTALYFDNVHVPAANVLGEVGRGHAIAFNILNIGRLELGPNMAGAAKDVLAASVQYASSRAAFGTTIASFGAVQHKLADMVARIFATESVTWRTVGLVEADTARRQGASALGRPEAEALAFEEFAAECSIVKVVASEMLDAVADHGVQIHGGYGYHRDYLVERAYRDARINRIFEGTNEINRLIVPGLILKRAVRVDRGLLAEAAAVRARVAELATTPPAVDDETMVARMRLVALLVFDAAHRRGGDALRDPQEAVMALADTIIEAFVAESVWLRAQAIGAAPTAALAAATARVCLCDALPRVAQAAATALPALLDQAEARAALAAVRALTATDAIDIVTLRRQIAEEAIGRARYPF